MKASRRQGLQGFMLATPLVVAAVAAQAATETVRVFQVVAPSVNLRDAPGKRARLVATAERGQQLEVLSWHGRWFKVRQVAGGCEACWVFRARDARGHPVLEQVEASSPPSSVEAATAAAPGLDAATHSMLLADGRPAETTAEGTEAVRSAAGADTQPLAPREPWARYQEQFLLLAPREPWLRVSPARGLREASWDSDAPDGEFLLTMASAHPTGQPVESEVSAVADGKTVRVLQVMAPTVVLRAAPSKRARPVATLDRGRQLEAIEQRGSWIKVRHAAGGRKTSWVLQEPDRYDQLTVEWVAVRAIPRLADAERGVDGTPVPVERPGERAPRAVTLPGVEAKQIPPPRANLPRESLPLPDRWRMMQALGYKFPWFDPYHQNVLKGDLPITQLGPDVFVNVIAVSDTLFEARSVPTPVAQAVAFGRLENDVYGSNEQYLFAQTALVGFSATRGDTTFMPPDMELRVLAAVNYNYARVGEAGALRIDPLEGKARDDSFAGVQEMFFDKHLWDVSTQYDFDSLRLGVQPFTSDFRGFLFLDQPFGVRLFGNRANNRFQYNVAWFRRLEKDTNSGLNDIVSGLREDDLFVANLYVQDFPILGFTSQVSAIHERNNETEIYYDNNGFLTRPSLAGDLVPHAYQVTYVGYNGDGHLSRLWPRLALNLTTSTWLALGHDEHNPIAGRAQDIRAAFHASELSRDFDWIRVRANLLLASGDSKPRDGVASGFDAILEVPQFAGADTAYFIRQGIPLIGGGGVALAGRNGILPSLRASRDEGQSNFVNPGLQLYGMGADFDVLPELRITTNVSYLRFMDTAVLGELRHQPDPDREIGFDFAVGFQYRPFFNQNLVINASASVLHLGEGLLELYGASQRNLYSTFVNAIATF